MNKNYHSWVDTHVAEGSWRKRNGAITIKTVATKIEMISPQIEECGFKIENGRLMKNVVISFLSTEDVLKIHDPIVFDGVDFGAGKERFIVSQKVDMGGTFLHKCILLSTILDTPYIFAAKLGKYAYA